MIDVLAATRELLLASAPLTALVGTRVYGLRLPEDHDFELGAVVITVVGGDSELYTPLVRPAVQLQCWGKDSVAAQTVYLAAREVLHDPGSKDLPGVGGALLNAFEETPGQDVVDPEVKRPYVVARFREILRKN